MTKRLIVCSDGTWQTPGQGPSTNVVKMAQAISAAAPGQMVFYDAGVGTEGNWFQRILGGISGRGLDKNIQDGYRFLINNYEPGDLIYLMGFSRGAYTVRSLAGLLRNSGLLRTIHADKLAEAFDLYRSNDVKPSSPEAVAFRTSHSHEVEIWFLGVWDTVGALGVPSRRFGHLLNRRHEFHDVELTGAVNHGYHALSIDERRAPFRPTLWKSVSKEGQKVEQVWFAGHHSDVGGGTRDAGLSDLTFAWIQEKAEASGLVFDSSYVGSMIHPKPLGPAHDPRSGIFRFTGTHERKLGVLAPATEFVHPEVITRYENDPPPYRPDNLVEYRKDPNYHVAQVAATTASPVPPGLRAPA